MLAFDFVFEKHRVRGFDGQNVGKPVLILMHGIGPGASLLNAFRPLLPFLNEHFHVIGMDWIGFGDSARKTEQPYADFEFWVRQGQALLSRVPGERVYVFGHSMSAAVALRLAGSDPCVAAVFTTGAAGTSFPYNDHMKRLWSFPKSAQDLKAAMSSLIHDTSNITDDQIESRWATLSSGDYGQYFASMLSDPEQLIADWTLSDSQLAAIKCPVTMLHGRNDVACPAEETSMILASKIQHANLILLDQCGHAPSVEQTAKVSGALMLAFPDVFNS